MQGIWPWSWSQGQSRWRNCISFFANALILFVCFARKMICSKSRWWRNAGSKEQWWSSFLWVRGSKYWGGGYWNSWKCLSMFKLTFWFYTTKITQGENMIKYTTNVIMSNFSHILTHKCKKVESKPFQSLSNHHGAQYWIYSMMYTKFGKLWCTKSRSKIFLKLTGGIVFKNTFTLKDWYIIIFTMEIESA
jgi:hypothetical protein